MSIEEPKTLIFNFDGTGNEPSDFNEYHEGESVSNILKLHALLGGLSKSNNNKQTSYYYNGIGTREDGASIPLLGFLITKVRQTVNMLVAPSWGDARRILKEAHRDFDSEYKKGDKLVVFGFSRGAALARKFVAEVLHNNQDCMVSFLGVFDTVAAMDGIHRAGEKISSDVVFENGTLDKKVKKAVHIVSLDENRVAFTPTLINRDEDELDRILEVWFPGVHSDIGGGYWHDGLSDLALQFMIEQCEETLGEDIEFADGTSYGAVKNLINNAVDEFSGLAVDDIIVNPQHKGMIHAHTGWEKHVADQSPRKVIVRDNDRPCNELPTVHHSVKQRFNDVGAYRPNALRSLNFELLDGNGKVKKVKGIAGLRKLQNPTVLPDKATSAVSENK